MQSSAMTLPTSPFIVSVPMYFTSLRPDAISLAGGGNRPLSIGQDKCELSANNSRSIMST